MLEDHLRVQTTWNSHPTHLIAREGDRVQRMLYVVCGHLQSSQFLRDGAKSYCMLGPGNFNGDELLSWCLRRPFVKRYYSPGWRMWAAVAIQLAWRRYNHRLTLTSLS